MDSINPATGERIARYTPHDDSEITRRIERADACAREWRSVSFEQRSVLMHKAAGLLLQRKEQLAALMTAEMGKLLKDGHAEIQKCAAVCSYYADHAQSFLRDDTIQTEARQSFITYQPLGVVLAIMPWNFPFWQVFRFAAPNFMAGNVGLLKHASNVTGCALAIETLFRDAGFPEGAFSALLIPGDAMEHIIEHPAIAAVTLTGSTSAGKKVAAKAGSVLKKTVLELGGSDPYVVLADADLPKAAELCAQSRLINAGQSCIAAKRFIIVHDVLHAFLDLFTAHFKAVRIGDPTDPAHHMGPLARVDLRDALHTQVERSIAQGAKRVLGGTIPEGKGAYYPPTILTGVTPGMVAFDEELFGPVAAIIEARDEDEAFALANLTSFGLGSAIFCAPERGAGLARTRIHAGQCFVNSFVKSDARLPFGGVKHSGYGRELGVHGIREFMNAKTVWVG